MKYFTIEVTDTFAGEANYCWVRRYQTKASTMRGAMRKLANHYGGYWKAAWSDTYSARYDMKGAAICAFVEFYDRDGWSDLGGAHYESI